MKELYTYRQAMILANAHFAQAEFYKTREQDDMVKQNLMLSLKFMILAMSSATMLALNEVKG